MKCQLCNKEMNGQRGLSSHLRQTHKFETLDQFKEYYDIYILDEDITCPVCKIHPRKFYSFRVGYTKTCMDQKDENGKLLNCRTHWANRDKEKASESQITAIQKLKETVSKEDPTKTQYQIHKEKWYKEMIKKDETGKTKFDKIGKKVSQSHLKINPNTGLSLATDYSKRAARSRIDKIFDDGESAAKKLAKKSANTVKNRIMPDGRTQSEHMIEKSVNTRMNTILPNGLSISKNLAKNAYDTKVTNGTLPKYHGYSKISESTFEQLITQLNLDRSRCYYADHEYQFINKEENQCHRYDFSYVDEFNNPILIIEFQGNQYHLRESELEIRKNDTDPHGRLLTEGYQTDVNKKNFINNNYPKCNFFYIWEDDIDSDLDVIYHSLSINPIKSKVSI